MEMKQEKLQLNWRMGYPILLVVYGLMLINQGITVTDTGYNYGNFVNFPTLDNMWKFSTYLATAVGAFFTRLPFGETMLGMNFYTGLIKIGTALLGYFFFTKKMGVKQEIAFLGELMALGFCWCPTALIYNYLTYFLFHLGAILLLLAEKERKSVYFLLAGAVLGTNVAVRLPNLAEMALIVALWIACFLEKRSFRETARRTMLCILGYVGAVLFWVILLFTIYSPDAVICGIKELLSMSKEADSYSLRSMIMGDLLYYWWYLRWIVYAGIVVLLGMVLYAVSKGKWLWPKRVIFLLANVALLAYYYKMGVFRFTYYNYQAMEAVGILFLILSGILGLFILFFAKDTSLRMSAALMGIIILITPLGSNNHLFSAENNLFFVAPFVLNLLYDFWENEKKEFLKLPLEPLKITLSVLTLFVFVQGVAFGMTFVFRDGIEGEKRTVTISNNDVLAGIYTSADNAASLQALNDYCNAENLKGQKAILFADVPALSYYMHLEPALSTTWPDLASFSLQKFTLELETIKEDYKTNGQRPLVIIGRQIARTDGSKEGLLLDFLEQLQYEQTFTTGEWVVYR